MDRSPAHIGPKGNGHRFFVRIYIDGKLQRSQVIAHGVHRQRARWD
jgi:hypothetical protein